MELLAVTALISLLLAVFLPVLTRVRAAADAGRCAANLRQLYTANVLYAAANGTYVAAAPDLFTSNLKRWHGIRDSISEPFDFSRSPLAPYLGGEGRIRYCPGFLRYRTEASDNAFESSCGGYGYNIYGVGSQCYLHGFNEKGVMSGMPPGMIKDPMHTVMFADCAFPQPYGDPKYLIEYSFVEAYHFVDGKGQESSQTAMPSIHFRHNGRANVAWCDGHVSAESMSFTCDDTFRKFAVGWFGPRDNSLLDPF